MEDETILELPQDHPMVVAFDAWQAKAGYTAGDEGEELRWECFSAGYEAAPREHRFDPIERNYEAIAILAHEAQRAADPGMLLPWLSEDQDIRQNSVKAVMAIERGADTSDMVKSQVFVAVARAALDMYDKHGGLAIEHLIDLGNFMMTEMGYQPGPNEVSIAESVKTFLVEQRAQKQALAAEVRKAEAGSSDLALREKALELTATSPYCEDPVEEAGRFLAFLKGEAPADPVMPELRGREDIFRSPEEIEAARAASPKAQAQ